MTETQETPRQSARAVWLRAKWARERAQRAVDRLSKQEGAPTGDAVQALKAANKTLSERTAAETKARKAYDATK